MRFAAFAAKRLTTTPPPAPYRGPWREAGEEPSLTAMLDDPTLRTLMRSDHLSRDDVLAAIDAARRALRKRAVGHRSAGSAADAPRLDAGP